MLYFTIDRDGEPVTDLGPHLDGFGHLTALRWATGAAHLPIRSAPGRIPPPARPSSSWSSLLPGSTGFIWTFRHGEAVQTVAFTVVSGGAGSSPVAPRPGHDGGH